MMWTRGFALLLVIACGCNKTVPIQAKVLSMNREEAVFDVQTEPGVTVLIEGGHGTTDDKGHAVVRVPLKKLLDRSSKYLRTAYVTVEGKKGLTEYYGHEEVKLPFTAEAAQNIPAKGDGPWMAITDSGSGTIFQLIKGDFGESSVRFDKGVGVLKLVGPPGAKIKIAGRETTLGPDGTGEAKLTREDLLARLQSGVATGRDAKHEAKIPVEIDAAGQKKAGDLLIDVSFREHMKELIAELVAGKPVSTRPAAAGPKLLLVEESPYWFARGRDGTLDGVDFVAVETETNVRPGPKCTGYGKGILGMGGKAPDLERRYVDLQVKVYDVRTARVVLERTLPGGGAGCPKVVINDKPVNDGPKEAAVHALLDEALKL